jgi:hypothetical protein
MVGLAQAEPDTLLETGHGSRSRIPDFEGLASVVMDIRKERRGYSDDETGWTLEIDGLSGIVPAVLIGWRRTDWEPVTVTTYAFEPTEATTLTRHRARRAEWSRHGKPGRRISLREAWELAGRVFDEAEARRQESREGEARQFFGATDDGTQ